MIKLLEALPRRVYVAVSGGVDSMSALDFVRKGKRLVHVLHFDHGTAHGKDARKFVEEYCKSEKLEVTVSTLKRSRDKSESLEEFWRNERIRFFREHTDAPIVTAHHLDDAVEWWVFTSLHGHSRLMSCRNHESGVVRPFLATPKSELISWAERKGVPHVSDPSNESRNYARNRIRHDIVPHALLINPGLHTTIRKLIIGDNAKNNSSKRTGDPGAAGNLAPP